MERELSKMLSEGWVIESGGELYKAHFLHHFLRRILTKIRLPDVVSPSFIFTDERKVPQHRAGSKKATKEAGNVAQPVGFVPMYRIVVVRESFPEVFTPYLAPAPENNTRLSCCKARSGRDGINGSHQNAKGGTHFLVPPGC
jgi:hypothetical protein